MLVLTRKNGEAVLIDGTVRVKVLSVQGSRVKLGFSAPLDVAIQREELLSQSSPQPIESLRAAAARRQCLQAAG